MIFVKFVNMVLGQHSYQKSASKQTNTSFDYADGDSLQNGKIHAHHDSI